MAASGGEIVVVGHEVHFRAPIVIVEGVAGSADHEIRGQRDVRRDFGERVTFRFEEFLERVGTESLEIEKLARIHEVAFADIPWRDDLGEVGHAL